MSKPEPTPRRPLLSMGIGRFAGEAPVQEWAVKGPKEEGGILPASAPILFVGQGSVGKTRAAFELGLKIAAYDGIGPAPKWMGQDIATVGVSVVLTYEEATDSIHRSIKKMADEAGIDPSVVDRRMLVKSYQDVDVEPLPLVANDPQIRQPVKTREYDELTREMREIVSQIGKIGCIIIDNAGTAFAADGNDYQSANQVMKWIQRWSAEFGALVIVIAHTNKGALKFETDNPSTNELLAAAMGSTGWVSAVRLAIMMWKISAEGEADIAKSLDDEEFEPGVTEGRYIRARVVKANVDDAYTGTLTLRRAGGTLEDVSAPMKSAKRAKVTEEMTSFAAAVGRCWTRGTHLQKSGNSGVFELRSSMGAPFDRMSKAALASLTERTIREGLVRLEPVAPGAKATRGNWLFDATGQGRRQVHLECMRRLMGKAYKAKVAVRTDNIEAWRGLLEAPMRDMPVDALAEALDELAQGASVRVEDGVVVVFPDLK